MTTGTPRDYLLEHGYTEAELDAISLLWNSPNVDQNLWHPRVTVFRDLGGDPDPFYAIGIRHLSASMSPELIVNAWGFPPPANPPDVRRDTGTWTSH